MRLHRSWAGACSSGTWTLPISLHFGAGEGGLMELFMPSTQVELGRALSPACREGAQSSSVQEPAREVFPLYLENADPFVRTRWGVGGGRAKQPSFFGGGFWGYFGVALGLHTSITDCGGCELIKCPEGEHTFKVKVGVFYRNIRFGESAGLPFIPGRWDGHQKCGLAISFQLADSARSSECCKCPQPLVPALICSLRLLVFLQSPDQ